MRKSREGKAGGRTRPVYLLLRGLIRETGHWGAFTEELGKSYRVFTLDLPGVGEERDRSSPLSIDEIVDDLRRRWLLLRESEQIRNPAGLLAVSFGGMIGLNWISRYGDDFHRLVLINSSSRLSPFYSRLRPSAYLDVFLAFMTQTLHRRESRIFMRTCNSDENRAGKIALWTRIAESRPLRRSTFLRQLWAALTFHLPVRIGIPLLILGARRDRLVDVRCSVALARYYDVDPILHPWAGHDLCTDDGRWVQRQMTVFDRKNGP